MHEEKCDHYIVLVGAAHAQNLSRILHKITKSSSEVYYDHRGRIKIANAQVGPIAMLDFATHPIEPLLREFIEKTQKGKDGS